MHCFKSDEEKLKINAIPNGEPVKSCEDGRDVTVEVLVNLQVNDQD